MGNCFFKMKFVLAALGLANAATSGIVTPTCGFTTTYYSDATCATAVASGTSTGLRTRTFPATAMNSCVSVKTSKVENAAAAADETAVNLKIHYCSKTEGMLAWKYNDAACTAPT